MRARRCVSKVIVLLTMLAVASNGYAQTAGPVANISSVVRGGVVTVSYDLVSNQPAAMFSVTLEASSDGGKTYSVRPKTMKGDVGPSVRAGTGKQITWDAARDVESLDVDRYRYRVVAQPVGPLASGAKPAQPSQPKVAASGGGSGRKWGGIALLGAGGALVFFSTRIDAYNSDCDCYKNSKPALYAGLGAAAGGVALLAMSGRNSSVRTGVTILPGLVMVQHRLPLK